jgi:release factor glutamine methyltransferase
MQLRTALQQGLELLRKGHVSAPELTAEVLLRHALRCERVYLYSHPEHELTEIEWLHYGRYLHERLKGKPTQYITRVQEFWGRDFHVEPGVLIPRPETEHVVEQALAALRDLPADNTGGVSNQLSLPVAAPNRILDIGTGSGILAITLALEAAAETFATDISNLALRVARRNAQALNAPCVFVRCDLGSAFAEDTFDVIVSNPPYIASTEIGTLQREVRDWEPREALDGGPDGLGIYARLIPEAGRLLRPKGSLILEIGAGQVESVPALFDAGWRTPAVVNDLAGLARVVVVRRT